MDSEESYMRHRELVFKGPQREQEQMDAAWLMLRNVPMIREVRNAGEKRLIVSYDIREMSYVELEQALIEVGFSLDNSLLAKLRRALYSYNEDTIRANLNLGSESLQGVAQKVFMNLYRQQEHGCRDHRPRHWREYL